MSRARGEAQVGDVRRFAAVLAAYQTESHDSVLVSWLGGEPLRWPALAALEECCATTLGLRLSVTTNGTTLSDAAVRSRVLRHYAELTVSVDTVGDAHDTLRGWPGGFAVLEREVSRLAEQKRRLASTLRLRANVVLMRETIGSFERLCERLAGWGIAEITFNLLGGNDRPEFFAEHHVKSSQFGEFAAALPELRRRLAGRDVMLSGSTQYAEHLAARVRGDVFAMPDCEPGERFLFIDELGRVAPCSFTPDTLGVPLAELQTPGDVRGLPGRFATARAARPPTACGNCLSTQVFGKFAA